MAVEVPDVKDDSTRVLLRLRDASLIVVLEDVHDRLEALLDHGPRELVVDMSEVAHLSSTTIAALLWIRQRCATRGVEIMLCAASRRNLEALRRIGLLSSPHSRSSPSGTATSLGRLT